MTRSSNYRISSHSIVRARQRGYRTGDLEKIEELGTTVSDGILLRSKDIASGIHQLTRRRRNLRARNTAEDFRDQRRIKQEEANIVKEIDQLRRLQGSYIPVQDGCILSVYRPSRRRLRRMLHR